MFKNLFKFNPFSVINKYHDPNSDYYHVLVIHSVLVTKLALKIAKKFKKADQRFIYEASMLHDIGYRFPDFEFSKNPNQELLAKIKKQKFYLGHGFWGASILRQEELKQHAKVAENHVGVGFRRSEIEKNNWPFPKRCFHPSSLEEEIISYADLFYSKKPKAIFQKESKIEIIKEIKGYYNGEEKLKVFEKWDKKFGGLCT
jgi:uncharacterized protein